MSQIHKRMGSFKTFAEYVRLRENMEPAAAPAVPTTSHSKKVSRGVAKAIGSMPADSAVDAIQAASTGNMRKNPMAVKQVVTRSLARPAINSIGDVSSVLGLNNDPQ